jgi:PAS domain-containing protein
MPQPSNETTREARLRRDAETRLNTGTAPPAGGWTVSPEALSLLYRLASVPDTAGDALKLLHELQAHQVELDLQHHQMEQDQRELADDLARYRTLFDSAPLAYFVCDPDGRIIESNLTGGRLLGAEPAALSGRNFTDSLLPESRSRLIEWLNSSLTADSNLSCEVRPAVASEDSCTWRLTATVVPGSDALTILMVVSEGAGFNNG